MRKKSVLLLPKDLSNMEIMGENIKLARKRRELTTIQIAERADIARSTLYLIENGDPSVAIGNYVRVLKVLNLSQDIFNIAVNDELGRKLQDIKLLGKEDNKVITIYENNRFIYDRIRIGLLKGEYNSDIEGIVGINAIELLERLNNNPYGFRVSDDFIDIDHIIPINNIKSQPNITQLNHYTNLQLLPREYNRNIKKTKKWNKEHFEKWYYDI